MVQYQANARPSSKRGFGWPWNNTAPEFAIYNPAISSSKITWLFNWEMWKPDGTPDTIEYIPQVRVGDQAPQIDQFLSSIPKDRLNYFMAFNEPESSLHPDLLEPLARLIVKASERTQVWLVTHSERLAAALAKYGKVQPRAVIKKEGATWIEGLKAIGGFADDDD